jgi:triosephosphate isomerase
MKIIAGNWKMNGSTEMLNTMLSTLATVETNNTVIICPPFTMLSTGKTSTQLGAQDCSAHESGAYTGEISAKMIADTGAKYIIVGHSERRQYHNESNDIVRKKAELALAAGLTPIICVGETMAEKENGTMKEIIEAQLHECINPSLFTLHSSLIIAYEPRWAIGAGLTPTSDEIADAHGFIANILDSIGLTGTPILYGASVKGSNAAEIMGIKNVDGVLVGGASLKPDDFIPIITAI